MSQQLTEPMVVVRGDVPDELVEYARDKLLAVLACTSIPVLAAEVRLVRHPDPARERPHHAEMTVDLDGLVVRAHRNAPTMPEAIDRTETRLRRRIEVAAERQRSRWKRHRDAQSWRHGDLPSVRPHCAPRTPDERQLVRRKTFAMLPESIEEALFDLESLDHDFFLFVHDETDAEAVVYRVGEGFGLMQRVPTPEAVEQIDVPLELGPHPSTTTLDNALTILDERGTPFEFFVDETNGRGMVTYRRYDGNYGLILPS